MATPPILPLFVDDFLGDTQHLSCEENGAYMLLLFAAWRSPDCSLADDDRKLARICRLSVRKWKSVRHALDEFWPVENGRIYNARLRRERAYVDQKSESNRQKANKRWNKQGAENKPGGGMPQHSRGNAPHPHSTTYTDVYVGDDGQSDPAKIIFETGHSILSDAGHDDHARRGRIIGNWRKQFGDDDRLIETLSRCIAMKPREPISWVNANINSRGPSNDRQPTKRFPDLNPRNDEPGNPYVAATLERKARRAAQEPGQPDHWPEDGHRAPQLAHGSTGTRDGYD